MSVEQRPGRRLPWLVRWRDDNGKSRSKSFKTKGEASVFQSALTLGHKPSTDRSTVGELFEHWFNNYSQEWAPSTHVQRAHIWYRNLEPFICGIRLHAFARRAIVEMRRAMLADGATPLTVNSAMRVLSACLSTAVDEGRIAQNPCLGMRRLPRDRPVDRRAIPADDVAALDAEMPTARDRLAFRLMAFAGLRPGELAELTSADVIGEHLRVYASKTRSHRLVPITEPVREALAAVDGQGRLLDGERGAPLNWNNWAGRVWKPACTRAGVRYAPYELRHTYASRLIDDGHNVVQVAAWMGHANPSTTLTHYSHLFALAQHRRDSSAPERDVNRS